MVQRIHVGVLFKHITRVSSLQRTGTPCLPHLPLSPPACLPCLPACPSRCPPSLREHPCPLHAARREARARPPRGKGGGEGAHGKQKAKTPKRAPANSKCAEPTPPSHACCSSCVPAVASALQESRNSRTTPWQQKRSNTFAMPSRNLRNTAPRAAVHATFGFETVRSRLFRNDFRGSFGHSPRARKLRRVCVGHGCASHGAKEMRPMPPSRFPRQHV